MKTYVYVFVVLAMLAGLFASPSAVFAAAACGDTYTVKSGDYLTKIAKTCEVTYDALLKANPEIKDPNKIFVGQVIRIKASASLPGVPVTGTQEYVVVKGDTLFKIATRYGTTVENMLKLNPEIKDASKIYVGQKLRVPTSGTTTGSAQVSLSSTSLRPGDSVDVTVKGFPANAEIDFRLGVSGQKFSVVLDGKTNDKGEASGKLTIPTTAKAGEKWVVQVLTTAMTNGKDVTSAVITLK
jgi:LysM repeat protein